MMTITPRAVRISAQASPDSVSPASVRTQIPTDTRAFVLASVLT